jgi:hypothetical protein
MERLSSDILGQPVYIVLLSIVAVLGSVLWKVWFFEISLQDLGLIELAVLNMDRHSIH